ncbi:MAG: serine hydrolase [Bacteroidetes bacterium]|nr:serine hydrolase [Bacteroidota bacterium]
MKIFKKFNLLLLIFLLTASFAFSQGKTNEEKLKDLDTLINQFLKDWKVPGVGISIVKNGKVVLAKGYGYRDVEGKLPVTENTLFSIGSCTKAFTAIDNCILVGKGELNLDKPVINYMPTFKMYDEYVTQHMTARDLMTHRSGLPRHDLMWYGSDLSRMELFNRLRFLEPSAGFREKFQYQNLMYMTAGILVEAISKDTWENFTKQNILIPLEMNNTNFSTFDSRATTDFAKPYREEKDKVKLIDFRDIQSVGPAGCINSNAKDMANWVIMHLNYGKFNGKKIVDEEMVITAHSPQIVTPGTPSKELFYGSYGLGWGINQYRDHLRLEHGGNIDGFSANVCLMPTDSLGIVILTNMDNTVLPSVVRNSIIDRMLELDPIDWNGRLLGMQKNDEGTQKPEEQKDPNQVENTTPSHPLVDYVGSFENEAYGTMKIELKNDNLLIDYHTFKIPLAHYHYDYFKSTSEDMPPMLVNFTIDEKGKVSKVYAQLEQGVKDIEFKKVPEFKDNSYAYEKYTGDYDLQGAVAKVSVKNNVLKLFIPGQPEYDLVPSGDNNFDIKDLKGYSVTFNMSDGKAAEIQFNQPNGVFKAKKK